MTIRVGVGSTSPPEVGTVELWGGSCQDRTPRCWWWEMDSPWPGASPTVTLCWEERPSQLQHPLKAARGMWSLTALEKNNFSLFFAKCCSYLLMHSVLFESFPWLRFPVNSGKRYNTHFQFLWWEGESVGGWNCGSLAGNSSSLLLFLRKRNKFLRDYWTLDLCSFSVVLAVGDSLKNWETNKVMASKNKWSNVWCVKSLKLFLLLSLLHKFSWESNEGILIFVLPCGSAGEEKQ